MLAAPIDATIANIIPTKLIILNDGPKTIIIPKKVTINRIFTANEIFSLSIMIE